MDVSADVAGRHAHRPRDRDEEVGEVLAHAGPQRQHVIDCAVHIRNRAVVCEIAADRDRELIERALDFGGRGRVRDRMPQRQLAHPVDLFHRRAKAQKILHELFAGIVIRGQSGFDSRAADHAQTGVRADQVEVVDVVAIPVDVSLRFYAVAQLKVEVEAALAVAVHGLQPDLHHGLGDGSGVPVPRAVHDLELHLCCCCWGMPRPSSPVTAAGTLLGWKYVSRSATSS